MNSFWWQRTHWRSRYMIGPFPLGSQPVLRFLQLTLIPSNLFRISVVSAKSWLYSMRTSWRKKNRARMFTLSGKMRLIHCSLTDEIFPSSKHHADSIWRQHLLRNAKTVQCQHLSLYMRCILHYLQCLLCYMQCFSHNMRCLRYYTWHIDYYMRCFRYIFVLTPTTSWYGGTFSWDCWRYRWI